MFDIDNTVLRNLELHLQPDVLRLTIIKVGLSLCLIKHRGVIKYGGVKISMRWDKIMISAIK
jgi:hypothetical protein